MNRSSSLRKIENRIIYEGSPPHGLLRGTAGRELFLDFSHRSAAGAPRRGRRHSTYQMDRVVTILESYLNNKVLFIHHCQKEEILQGSQKQFF
jgi:hypothetical protein